MNKSSMNYRDFHGDGDFMAVHFIVDQSRTEPPYRRATLMMDACSLFAHESTKEARGELYALAVECFDCEQEAQRAIGSLRSANAKGIAASSAVAFLLEKIEHADLRTKADFLDNPNAMGLASTDVSVVSAITHARERIEAFEQRLDVFMFRVRTHHWRNSNSETLANEQTPVPQAAA